MNPKRDSHFPDRETQFSVMKAGSWELANNLQYLADFLSVFRLNEYN
jgi:hypothetical protein